MSHGIGFTCRYLFRGQIELQAGMHLGGGRIAITPTDSPTVRTPEGKPYIPGSSMKGALRASVERLCHGLGSTDLWSCALDGSSNCVGAPGETQRRFFQKKRERNWSEEDVLRELNPSTLCSTCRLFGSPFLASKILFSDLYLRKDQGDGFVQIRDSVAIDRDTEGAVDGLKYDYEVVSATQSFDLLIQLDEPVTDDLALTALGLTEFLSGLAHLGGLKSRGLGRCSLKDLEVFMIDLRTDDVAEKARRFRKYLLGTKPEDKFSKLPHAEMFLQEQIDQIFAVSMR